VWLFEPQRSGQGGKLVRWQLGMGALDQIPIDAERFDAIGDGPLLSVRSCGNLCTILETRPLVAGGTLATLVSSKGVIGPVRIAPSGTRGVYEEGGSNLIDLAGGAVQTVGVEGDRSPAFALPGEQAIVYTTDDGQLDYHFISGPQAGQDAAIPPGWKNVFSPDWAATPDSCGPTSCF
jgi:hypothetical protein